MIWACWTEPTPLKLISLNVKTIQSGEAKSSQEKIMGKPNTQSRIYSHAPCSHLGLFCWLCLQASAYFIQRRGCLWEASESIGLTEGSRAFLFTSKISYLRSNLIELIYLLSDYGFDRLQPRLRVQKKMRVRCWEKNASWGLYFFLTATQLLPYGSAALVIWGGGERRDPLLSEQRMAVKLPSN